MNQYPVFGIYEKALHPDSFERMMDDAASCGYSSLEFSLDSTNERLSRLNWSHQQIAALRAASVNSGVSILTTCLSGHKRFPLGSSDPAVVKCGMELMQKAIDFCAEAGIRVIQLSGFDVYDQEPRTDITRARYEDNLVKCVEMAERACVTLAIEPVEGNLLCVTDTMEVVRRIDSPFLQVYPDPANICSLGIEPIADLYAGKGHIAAVHMRESLPNQFDATVPFGTGNLDFKGVFRALDDIGFHGPLIVEMWNENRENYLEYITQARVFMQNVLDELRSEKHV